MESPKRRALKSRDYRRHRMMRLLNRRKATAQEAMSEIAERELMRRLRITPLKKFEDGKDAEYDAGVLDDVVITGHRRPANIMFDKDTGNYYRESTGDVVTPVNKLVEDDPSTWSFTDKNGTTFTPHGPVFNSNQGEIRLAEEAPFLSNDYIKQAAHNYMSELAYDINNNRVVGGKYTMPAIALAPVLSNPVGEAAINSAFAAHGLNHAINEGVDGLGDATMTTLEMLPLYGVMANVGKRLKDYTNTVGLFGEDGKLFNSKIVRKPENFYRAVGKDAIKDAESSGVVRGRRDRIDDPYPYFARSIEPYHDTSYVIEGTPDSADQWISAYKYTNQNKPVVEKLPKYPEIDFSSGYETVLSSPDSNGFYKEGGFDLDFLEKYEALPMTNGSVNASPVQNFTYWKKYPLFGWRKKFFKTPTDKPVTITLENDTKITAENAASMTPEQWTAAQDAAIARGDMAEAQRLRDLHFEISAPNPHISKGVYLPSGKQPTLSPADYYNGNTDLVTLYHSSVDADNLIKEGFDGIEHGLGRTKGEPKGTIFASANQDYAADYSNLYVQEGFSTPDKVGLMELKVPRGAGVYEGNEIRLRPEHIKEITKSAYEKTPWLKWLKTRKTDNSLYNIKSADAVTYGDNGVRIPLGERDNFNIKDIRYNIADSDFESFTIPTEELQTQLNAPINNPVVINGKEYPTMKALMNKVEMVKPDELNAAHLLAQKEIRMYLESPEYRQRLIDNGFDPDKYIPALEHYLGSRVKYGDLDLNTNGVTEIVNGKPEITLNSSVFDTDYDTLVHELAHALTKNLDHSMYVKSFIDARLKDIMLYNEKVLPQLDRDVAARSGISINRLTYLNDPQEIRARMIAIIMDARRKGIKLSEYIDRVKSNRLLNDLKSFLKVEDIKKYGADILAVTPFAIPFAKKNKQKGVK